MTKNIKTALLLGVPLVTFGTYWFLIRNRRPILSFESIDWLNKRGVVKFGSTKNNFNENKSFAAGAGKTYSDLYSMTASPDGKGKIIFNVFKNGTLKVESVVVDFAARLKYEGLVEWQ